MSAWVLNLNSFSLESPFGREKPSPYGNALSDRNLTESFIRRNLYRSLEPDTKDWEREEGVESPVCFMVNDMCIYCIVF